MFTGFFVFAKSQILTVMKSRLIICLPLELKAMEEIDEIISLKKFLFPEGSTKKFVAESQRAKLVE